MKLDLFLSKLKQNCDEVIYLCALQMLKKKYNIDKDDISEDEICSFFINYNNYDKFLNDYANVIYNQFKSSNDEVYVNLCNYFNQKSDNKYLFEYRLKRLSNQDPKRYLNIEDPEMRNAAILRAENKIKIIEESDYYKNNADLGRNEINKLKAEIDLVKRAVGL